MPKARSRPSSARHWIRNCGCHYTDNVKDYADYKSNVTLIATHADFHVPFAGIFPQGFDGMPVYLAVEERVVNQLPIPMPSIECGVEDEFGVITAADRALFAEWFAAGAPDGANFP